MTELNLELPDFDSSPTMPQVEVVRVRLGDLARSVESARQQGVLEANVANKTLDLLKQVVALLPTP